MDLFWRKISLALFFLGFGLFNSDSGHTRLSNHDTLKQLVFTEELPSVTLAQH